MWKRILLWSRRRLRIHLLEGMLLRRRLQSIRDNLELIKIKHAYLLAGMTVVHLLVLQDGTVNGKAWKIKIYYQKFHHNIKVARICFYLTTKKNSRLRKTCQHL